MSGPKSGSYDYDPPPIDPAVRLKLQADIEECRRRFQEIQREIAAESARLSADDFDLEVHPPSGSVQADTESSLRSILASWSSACSTAQAALSREIRRIDLGRELRSLAGEGPAEPMKQFRRSASQKSAAAAARTAASWPTRAERIVSRISAGFPEKSRTRAQEVLRQLPERQDAVWISGLLSELSHVVEQGNRAAAEHLAREERARELLGALDSNQVGPEDPARRIVREILDNHAPFSDEQECAVVQAVERREQERRRANGEAILRSTLERLGYEVQGGDFSTLFVEGGEIFFSRPSWGKDYAVRLATKPEQSWMNVHVVRYNTPGAIESGMKARDQRAEERWCEELPEFTRELAEAGIRIDLSRRLAAGAVPVPAIQRETTPAASREPSRKAAAPPAREREAGR